MGPTHTTHEQDYQKKLILFNYTVDRNILTCVYHAGRVFSHNKWYIVHSAFYVVLETATAI